MSLAAVTIEEAVGAAQDTVDLTGYLHLLGADEHSGTTSSGYTGFPLDGSSTGLVYSYERWVRARFDPGFTNVSAFRFYSPTVATLPTGWTFRMGTTSTYATPVNTASTIATATMRHNDPGRLAPNVGGGSSPVDGTVTRYSDWIVIQAVVDTSTVSGSGPAFGYSSGSTPNLIEFDFYWTESV